MAAALQENLSAAQGDQGFDLGGDLLIGEDITAPAAGRGAEGAESAMGTADIGVVDVAFDDIGADARTVEAVGDLGGPAGQIGQRTGLIKFNRLLGRYHGIITYYNYT